MAATASGSGSDERDTTSKDAADSQLSISPSVSQVQAPRVTLTIDFGSLTLESIGAISEFVRAALAASPATAIGKASAGGEVKPGGGKPGKDAPAIG